MIQPACSCFNCITMLVADNKTPTLCLSSFIIPTLVNVNLQLVRSWWLPTLRFAHSLLLTQNFWNSEAGLLTRCLKLSLNIACYPQHWHKLRPCKNRRNNNIPERSGKPARIDENLNLWAEIGMRWGHTDRDGLWNWEPSSSGSLLMLLCSPRR